MRIAEHIGVPKCKHPVDDPYEAGKESEKRVKPNAVSAAANTWACAAQEMKAAKCPLPHITRHMPVP